MKNIFYLSLFLIVNYTYSQEINASENTSIYIPSEGMMFKKVLVELMTSDDNKGNATIDSDIYSYKTIISTQSSENSINDIVLHKIGTYRNDSYEIEELNIRQVYRFNGDKFVKIN